ncbi:hypothetical protein EF847_14210 [Actinobacteria bacterium YIM 96077]|uniref:Polyketide cyclase n=1 Tax=Phytoactinopolyspora halophila TaxID=1981511 RepID=A0A329QFZ6_9ACTN|nr:SRPBCC family protein [Phytoactinopolyspora halophila]AYY13677.1 hypothetical protein EF847_14210 [Actinobacteria bacterium YIM 96077]RAW11240.1 hypothetical protein DPM12_17120 [Phytoactinopolyspora halophila]
MIRDRRPARSYAFESVWSIDAPVERCWEFLAAPGQQWHDWWPHLHAIRIWRTDGVAGSRARCLWKTPLGVLLRTQLCVVDVEPLRRVEMSVDGDLDGTGTVRFAGAGERTTRIEVTWRVVTKPWWMNVTAPALAPIFAWSHHRAMRGGEKGLNAILDAAR